MKLRNTNTTISLLALVCLALAPVIALAHGGLEHVQGKIKTIADASVTVTTTAGKVVVVGLDAKTTYTRDTKPVTKADMKVGDRVVIHAAEVDEKLIAKTVELGTAAATKTAPATK
jgi:hypothetical protein